MKNTLLTTTALALTSFAGTASAVEIAAGAVNLNISGSFATTAAISSATIGAGSDNAGADYDGVDILTTSEIHFRPSITLDNGITIGADVELEGNTSSDQIDESTIFATGGFGRIELGSKDSAGKLMQVSAPDVSLVYAVSSSLTAFVPFSAPAKGDFANDADRLTYFTPNFGGFRLGVSYARDSAQTNGPVNNNAAGIGTDYADIGFTYGGTVGEVAVSFSARYGTYDRGMKPSVAAAALTASNAAAAAVSLNTAAIALYNQYDTAFSDTTTGTVAERASAVTAASAAGVLETANALPNSTAAEITTRDAAIAAAKAAQNLLIASTRANALPADTGASTTRADAIAAVAAAIIADTATATANTATAVLGTAAALSRTDAEIARDVAASAGAHPTIAGVGLSLGFGDVSIGGGYVERDDKDGLSETKTYDIGVSYVSGPMGYSLTYIHDKQTGSSENELLVAAATYTVNPNFVVGASLSAFDNDAAGGPRGDIDGTIFGLSASFSF